MILVPMETAGVTIRRMLPVFGYDAPSRIVFDKVRVPASNILSAKGEVRDRAGPPRLTASTTACVWSAPPALRPCAVA
jgi:alkylation response protein AidB-like acyl-CoA dehydrogenase